jgi:predicted Fe-Mo cluster-binding NifX family protein
LYAVVGLPIMVLTIWYGYKEDDGGEKPKIGWGLASVWAIVLLLAIPWETFPHPADWRLSLAEARGVAIERQRRQQWHNEIKPPKSKEIGRGPRTAEVLGRAARKTVVALPQESTEPVRVEIKPPKSKEIGRGPRTAEELDRAVRKTVVALPRESTEPVMVPPGKGCYIYAEECVEVRVVIVKPSGHKYHRGRYLVCAKNNGEERVLIKPFPKQDSGELFYRSLAKKKGGIEVTFEIF